MNDITILQRGFMQLDFTNVNIFKTEGDPSSLLESAEFNHISFPLKTIGNGPRCINYSSITEKKYFGFCLDNPSQVKNWILYAEMFNLCRKGINPQEASKYISKCLSNIQQNQNISNNQFNDNNNNIKNYSIIENSNKVSLFENDNQLANNKKNCPNCKKIIQN